MGTQLLVTLVTNGYSDANQVFSTGQRNLRELVFIVWGFTSNSSSSKAPKLKCRWRGQSYLQRFELWNGEGEGWRSQPSSKLMVSWVLSCTCGVILWMYFSGAIARVLLQLHWKSCRQGRPSASPAEAIFLQWQSSSHRSRQWPLYPSSTALCWVHFSPAQGFTSRLPPSKARQVQHPRQAGPLRHRAPMCYSWKDDKASKQQPTACLRHGPLHEEQHSTLPQPNKSLCLAEVYQMNPNRGKFSSDVWASSVRQLGAARWYDRPLGKPCSFCLRNHPPLFSTYSFFLITPTLPWQR